MPFGTFCPARASGRQISNADIGSGANIAKAKLADDAVRYLLPPNAFLSDATIAASGVFSVLTFANAAAKVARSSIQLPNRWSSSDITVKIWALTTATTGNARFVVSYKSVQADGTTASEDSATLLSAVPAVASNIFALSETLSSANFADGDILGIQVDRDPDHADDTAAADVLVLGIELIVSHR